MQNLTLMDDKDLSYAYNLKSLKKKSLIIVQMLLFIPLSLNLTLHFLQIINQCNALFLIR